jgi:hypothetical protein
VGNPAPDLYPARGNGDASVDVTDDVEERRVDDEIAVDVAKDRHRAAHNVEIAVDRSTSRNLHGRAGHELGGRGGTILPEQDENGGNKNAGDGRRARSRDERFAPPAAASLGSPLAGRGERRRAHEHQHLPDSCTPLRPACHLARQVKSSCARPLTAPRGS